MRTPFILLATAATSVILFGTQSAFAQDRDPFTGPRLEANIAYESTHADDGVVSTPNSVDGLRIGGAIGYDMALGDKVTIGVEAGGGYTVSGNATGQIGTTAYRVTAGHDFDASLRLGFRAASRTLVYTKGGYANSQFSLRTTTGGSSGTVSDDEDGWRIGAGVEQSFGDHFYAKAEYRYTDYGNDVSRHQGLVGLGYRF